MTDKPDTATRASDLLALHRAPELLTVVNVWDVISAQVVTDIEGTTALATASHSIAASRGYEDGENIPVDEMIAEVGRIAAATHLPVSADLEGGYGNAPETIRKAIGVGIVGANIEDQMKPLAEAAAQVEAIMKAAAAEGVPGLRAQRPHRRLPPRPATGTRRRCWPTPIERGKAFLDAGAPVVFVPGRLDEDADRRRWSTRSGRSGSPPSAIPGTPSLARQAELGVARVSFGPMSQRVALTALAKLVEGVHGAAASRPTCVLNCNA